MNFFVVTCNFKGNSFQKIFRLIKAITYPSSVVQTPGPLISVLADKVKLTQCNKHINKRHAITNLFCSNKGTEKRIYVCYNSSQRRIKLSQTHFLFVAYKLRVKDIRSLTAHFIISQTHTCLFPPY